MYVYEFVSKLYHTQKYIQRRLTYYPSNVCTLAFTPKLPIQPLAQYQILAKQVEVQVQESAAQQ